MPLVEIHQDAEEFHTALHLEVGGLGKPWGQCLRALPPAPENPAAAEEAARATLTSKTQQGPQPRARAVVSEGPGNLERGQGPGSLPAMMWLQPPWTTAVTVMNPTTPDSAEAPMVLAPRTPWGHHGHCDPDHPGHGGGSHHPSACYGNTSHSRTQASKRQRQPQKHKGARQISGRGSGERSEILT